jgi:hypothetical protein
MKETFPLKAVKQVVKCCSTIDCTLSNSKNGISTPLNSKRQDMMKSIFQSCVTQNRHRKLEGLNM